jgi:hypothetical protein
MRFYGYPTQLTGAFGVSGFDLDAIYGKGAFLQGR